MRRSSTPRRLTTNLPVLLGALLAACSSDHQHGQAGASGASATSQGASAGASSSHGGSSAVGGIGGSGGTAGSHAASGAAGVVANSAGKGGSSRGGSSAAGSKAAGSSAGGMSAGRGAGGRHSGNAGASGAGNTGGAMLGDAGAGGSGAETTASSGCGKTGMQTGDFHLTTTDGDGTSRDYEVLVPASYAPNTPLALTIAYHGAGGSEADAKSFGLQDAPGAAASSIFVFPQGIAYENYGVGWDDLCGGRDMVLFDHMVETLEANYCVDTTRRFIAGFSWGCDHVTSLTCCRGSKLRAVAAASCTDEFGDPSDYRTYDNLPCPSSPSVPIRFTYDPNGDAGFSAQEFASTLALYRSWDSCGTDSVAAGSDCVSYQGCTEPMLDCRYPGLGHTLPPNWGNDTWSFFTGL